MTPAALEPASAATPTAAASPTAGASPTTAASRTLSVAERPGVGQASVKSVLRIARGVRIERVDPADVDVRCAAVELGCTDRSIPAIPLDAGPVVPDSGQDRVTTAPDHQKRDKNGCELAVGEPAQERMIHPFGTCRQGQRGSGRPDLPYQAPAARMDRPA